LGRNFDDLPLLPIEDNPVGVVADGSQAGASRVSKARTVTVLPSVSLGELDPFVEYVPRLVPHAPRTTSKRVRANDTSTCASATKKPHPPSTRLGTQVIGIMLLGEHINVPYFPLIFLYVSLPEYFFLFRWQCGGDSRG
jgi:hypothetical protein